MAKSGAVEFTADEVAQAVGAEAFGDDGVSDPAFDVLVDAEVEGGEQVGPANENEVVVLGKSSKRSRSLRRLARSMRWAALSVRWRS